MYDLVAATLLSTPAKRGIRRSAISASGESSELHSATTQAPQDFALAAAASRSGLRPDWEIARNKTPRRSGFASYSELSDGAAEEVSTFVWLSMRYFAKVAA